MSEELKADEWVATDVVASERSMQETLLCYGEAASIQKEPGGQFYVARRREARDGPPTASPAVLLRPRFQGFAHESFGKVGHLPLPDMSKRGNIEITPNTAQWCFHDLFFTREPGGDAWFMAGEQMTATELLQREAEWRASMLAKATADAEALREKAELDVAQAAEQLAQETARKERIETAGKKHPRLKATELFKAGVLFIPERGEQPDPEKFGRELLVCFKESDGNGGIWAHVEFDAGIRRWCLKDECQRVDPSDIECWMLPPALKE